MDFFPGCAQPAAWTIQGGYPGSANVAPRVQLQAVWLGNEAPATRRGRRRRCPHGICLTTVFYSIGVRPCRAQQPSARSQPFDRQSLSLNSSKKFRLTLSHEGTSHCDLSILRARHTNRHMNEGTAKKGPQPVSISYRLGRCEPIIRADNDPTAWGGGLRRQHSGSRPATSQS